jgi:hypothetical protein
MQCGIIYIKILPKATSAEWIKYCNLFGALPDFFQLDIMSTVARINETFQNELIVPMYNNVHPGCIVKSEYVDIVANEVYKRFDSLMKEILDENCIRCVYSVGDVIDPNKDINIHYSNGKGLIEVGNYLDSSDNIGLYEI